MKNKAYTASECITFLTQLGERQLDQERQARTYLETVLSDHTIAYHVQEYQVEIPSYPDWGLVADGQDITSQPCGLRSGEIPLPDNILSSLISSQKNLYDANINFNPRCPVISKSNHYQAPALAIAHQDLEMIIKAERVHAWMKVEPVRHTSANILVGNRVNPQFLLVSHYDSVNQGAVDNASGVALSLDLIINHPEVLAHTCFALCGNEEISFDEPIYWGHGYRVLEEEYPALIRNPRGIIVVDSFGHSPIEVITQKPTLILGFPIKEIDAVLSKTQMISGSYEGLMKFYHSCDDTPELIVQEFYQQAYDHCLKTLTDEA